MILLPEGLIEFIPEIGALISEVNDLLAAGLPPTDDALLAEGKLTANSAAVFRMLPAAIREQLLLDRDPHGNVQVWRWRPARDCSSGERQYLVE